MKGKKIAAEAGGDRLILARIYMAYHRSYLTEANIPKAKAADPAIARFFDSFQLSPDALKEPRLLYQWKVASHNASVAVSDVIERNMRLHTSGVWHDPESLRITRSLIESQMNKADAASRERLEAHLAWLEHLIRAKSQPAATNTEDRPVRWQKCPGELVQGYRYVCNNGTVYVGTSNNVPIPCRFCGGRGVIRVDDAQSRPQPGPSGSGTRARCPTCHGTGRCQFCAGMGRTLSCYACGGDGRAGDDNSFCNNCSGTGKQTCWHCAGRGTGRCSTCGGSGSVSRN